MMLFRPKNSSAPFMHGYAFKYKFKGHRPGLRKIYVLMPFNLLFRLGSYVMRVGRWMKHG